MTHTQITTADLDSSIGDLLAGTAVVALVPATELGGWAAQMAWRVAETAARLGRRTCLVDCFVDAPSLHATANLPNDLGLVDAFEYGASLNRIVHTMPQPNLFFIPAGTYSADVTSLIAHPRWRRLAAGFRHEDALLLLYVPGRFLARLAAQPDGILVLSPKGMDVAMAEAPHLAEVIARGMTVLGAVAEPDLGKPAPQARVVESLPLAPSSSPPPLSRTGPAPAPSPPAYPRPVRGGLVTFMLLLSAAVLSWTYREELRPWTDPVVRKVRAMFGFHEPAAVPADTAPAPPPPPRPSLPVDTLPFVLGVASWRDLDVALANGDSIEARSGTGAILMPVRVRTDIVWRVYAGPFRSRERADSVRSALRQARLLGPRAGSIDSLPLSAALTGGLTRDEAVEERARLRRLGMPAFVLGQSDGSFRVYMGAFLSASSATTLQDLLTPTGNAGDIVPRVGITP